MPSEERNHLQDERWIQHCECADERITDGILSKDAMIQEVTDRIGFGGTLFLLDIDELKRIDDVFGKELGENLLEEFACEIKNLFRNSDIVGSLGGDHFAVFMPQQWMSESTISHIVDRFEEKIQKKMTDSDLGAMLEKGAQIYVLVAQKDEYHDFSEVYQRLVQAMAHAKQTDTADVAGCIVTEEKSAVFTHVFSKKVHEALTDEETMTALQTMNTALYGNFFIRLEDMSYVILRENEKTRIVDTNQTDANQMFYECIERFAKPEYKEMLHEFYDLNTLAARMSDRDSLKCEYQDTLFGWCLADFVATKREQGVVTQVMLLQSDLTEAMRKDAEERELLFIKKKANELLTNSEVLFISMIHKKTGATRVIQSSHLIDPERVFDFESSIKKEAQYLDEAVREEFLGKVSLDEINRKLAMQKEYTLSALLQKRNKEQRFIVYHFEVFDETQDYILAVTEDVTEQITRDGVTKYMNFEGFRLRCHALFASEVKAPYLILNFNISNFKAINSLYGYEAGNWVLRNVVKKLSESSMKFEAVCRESADNFFCLCRSDRIDEDEIDRLCKIPLSDSFGIEITISMFCGIYNVYDETEKLQSMCDKARMARRRAEQESGISFEIFDVTVENQYLDAATILASMPKALKYKELVVYYQPIYDAKSGKIASAESLVRWQHPQKGLLPPGVFIPAIEKTGQIAEVDYYVATCVQKLQKRRIAEGKKVIPVSVNMSRYDFLRQAKMDRVLEMLRQQPELTNAIRIEITESGFVNIPENGDLFIRELRRLGIKTMIDDFGTGYSSLVSIAECPCDIIKLDMSFAQKISMETKIEAIIIAIIHTAHRLGIQVVAEGVEEKTQYEFLKKNHCDYIQGYYFSRPVSETVFEEMLDRETN